MATARTIAIVGAAEDEITQLRALIERHRSEMRDSWQIGPENAADLVLADIDSVYGHMGWLKAHGSGRLTAVYTDAPNPKDPGHVLLKPAEGHALAALLNQVSADLGSGNADRAAATPPPPSRPAAQERAPVATPERAPAPIATPTPVPASVATPKPAPPRDVAPPAPTPPSYMGSANEPSVSAPAPKPAPPAMAHPTPLPPSARAPEPIEPAPMPVAREFYLDDVLTGAVAVEGVVKLVADGLPPLVLDPRAQVYHAPQSLKALLPWGERALTWADFSTISETELAPIKAAHPAQPFVRLLWAARLARGRGELDPSLDPTARYKLSRWPQSEREFPKHFRIATAMMKQSAMLPEIAEQSNAPASDVADFINAYYAIGFIDAEGGAAAAASEAAGRGAGLLGRFRKPFGNG